MKLFKRKTKTQPKVLDPRMYILVRSDLAPGLQAAQACHAASYLSASNPLLLYQHPTTIVLGVKDMHELMRYVEETQHLGFLFIEPDLDYEATAYAIYSSSLYNVSFDELPLALSF